VRWRRRLNAKTYQVDRLIAYSSCAPTGVQLSYLNGDHSSSQFVCDEMSLLARDKVVRSFSISKVSVTSFSCSLWIFMAY
jgi:hypothetical protein